MRLTFSDLPQSILTALVRRAVADCTHADTDIRQDAARFMERIASSVQWKVKAGS